MDIIHASFIPTSKKSFENTGQFVVWVETSNAKNNFYYKDKKIIEFFNEDLGLKKSNFIKKENLEEYFFLLPASDDKPLSSFKMMIHNDKEIPESYKFDYFKISCIKLDLVTSFLKELYFLSFYFPNDIQLGRDMLFWCGYFREFKIIFLKDQYIPAIFCEEKKSKFHTGWKIVSNSYEENLEKQSEIMPTICAAGFETKPKENIYFDKVTLLKNFSEQILNKLISSVKFNEKIKKSVRDTFIEGCINSNIEDDFDEKTWRKIWRKWFVWQNQLISSQMQQSFYLVLRLNEADIKDKNNWIIDFLVESKKDPSFKITLSEYWESTSKKRQNYSAIFDKNFERNLLLQLGLASRIYKKIGDSLNTLFPTGFSLNINEAFKFLKEEAWILQDAGYKVIIPSWFSPNGMQKIKIKLKLKTKSSNKEKEKNISTGLFGLDSIIEFNYELSIGDKKVSEKEWKMLVESKTSLVNFRGEWLELNSEKMQEMLKFWQDNKNKNSMMSLPDLIKKMSSSEENDLNLTFDENLCSTMNFLWDKNEFEKIKTPSKFVGKLRNYQKNGLSWLYHLEKIGMNPCLADDMGLGKTIQILAFLIQKKLENKKINALLIAPTSVLGNWEKESNKFTPNLNVHIFHGTKREKDVKDFKKLFEKNDMIITSFSLARRDNKIINSFEWDYIIIDEAQNIKNPKSDQTRAITKLKGKYKIALTGTPIENRLLDLWSIFNFLNPDYLYNMTQFKKKFEYPIQKENDTGKAKILKKIVDPFILRRTKNDKNIIKDLPEKIEQKVYCNLTKEQGTLYQALVDNVDEKIKSSEGIERKGIILSTLMKLKQICNHPAQFLQDESEFAIKRSHKLERLIEMIEEVFALKESLLIFTQFTEIGKSLQHLLKTQYNYNTYYIHGGVNRKSREKMITQFQDENTEPSIFVLSLKAGGTGITLTKANHVFHFDRWWNPAVENQATDRAYRIGQNKKVFAHKFITLGTLEERIDQMLEKKKKIADSIISKNDESWLTELDNDAFLNLIKLRKNSIMED